MRQRSVWYAEDDEDIAQYVSGFLEEAGYRVRIFADGLRLRNALYGDAPDALLLDWSLPDDAGPSICRWARLRDAALPIMMLTVRDDPRDIVAGLKSGADDYVVKPFDREVLLCRIEALLRRVPSDMAVLACGDIRLNEEAHAVAVGGEPIELTPLEYRLLALFMRNKGRIVSREALRESVWESEGAQVSDNALTVSVKRLRAKLGGCDHLKTVRSFGYRLEEPR